VNAQPRAAGAPPVPSEQRLGEPQNGGHPYNAIQRPRPASRQSVSAVIGEDALDQPGELDGREEQGCHVTNGDTCQADDVRGFGTSSRKLWLGAARSFGWGNAPVLSGWLLLWLAYLATGQSAGYRGGLLGLAVGIVVLVLVLFAPLPVTIWSAVSSLRPVRRWSAVAVAAGGLVGVEVWLAVEWPAGRIPLWVYSAAGFGGWVAAGLLLSPLLVRVYRRILRTSQVPRAWGVASVVLTGGLGALLCYLCLRAGNPGRQPGDNPLGDIAPDPLALPLLAAVLGCYTVIAFLRRAGETAQHPRSR